LRTPHPPALSERYDRQLYEPLSRKASQDWRSDLMDREKGPESNLQTPSFTAKRNGGNCYEHTNAKE
jgi:hypothetical protein